MWQVDKFKRRLKLMGKPIRKLIWFVDFTCIFFYNSIYSKCFYLYFVLEHIEMVGVSCMNHFNERCYFVIYVIDFAIPVLRDWFLILKLMCHPMIKVLQVYHRSKFSFRNYEHANCL